MSIARGFTIRAKRTDMPSPPLDRSKSTKNPGQPIDRAKISSPVALVSTTNMLSYNAPDIATLRQASSPSSHDAADDSDRSSTSNRSRASSHGSQDTLTDVSSVGSSPTSPMPNHLSGYFANAGNETSPANKTPRRSISSGNLHRKSQSIDAVPAIPERALSHSKRAHERLAQKRSLQQMSSKTSPHTSINSTIHGGVFRRESGRSSHSSHSHERRTSLEMFQLNVESTSHPFGKELEQLNEVAEEFGGVVRDAEMEADMACMQEKGLVKFCAADYLQEITPLFGARFSSNRFANRHLQPPAPMAWI